MLPDVVLQTLEYAKKLMALKESDREIVTAQIDFLIERENHGN